MLKSSFLCYVPVRLWEKEIFWFKEPILLAHKALSTDFQLSFTFYIPFPLQAAQNPPANTVKKAELLHHYILLSCYLSDCKQHYATWKQIPEGKLLAKELQTLEWGRITFEKFLQWRSIEILLYLTRKL